MIKAFIYAGFFGGVVASGFLWNFIGPKHHFAVLGFHGAWHFLAFPFVSAALSGTVAQQFHHWRPLFVVGVKFGVLVALASFLLFTLLLSVYVGGLQFPYVFVGFSLFGSLMCGWALLIIGGLTGWLVARKEKIAPQHAAAPDGLRPPVS